jgi:hypothetical protein
MWAMMPILRTLCNSAAFMFELSLMGKKKGRLGRRPFQVC